MTQPLSSPQVYVPKKSPLFLFLALAVFALLVAFSFYLGLQRSAIQDERERLDGEISQLKSEIAALEGDRVEAAQSAQAWLAQVSKNEIRWSGVLTRLNNLMPLDAVTKGYKIEFLSYSGNQGGRLTLNATTRPLQSEPYPDVADLLAVFNSSSYFTNAYVPNITRGEDDQGRKVLSFLFNVLYSETSANIGSADAESTDADAENSDTDTKVPRQ